MLVKKRIILASSSPRRKILLKQLGIDFEVYESGIDEDLDGIESPIEHVKKLSLLKAEEVAESIDNAFIIGADTIVVLDGKILGKPKDKSEAIMMLNMLSGRTHNVYTGFTILDKPSNKFITDYEITKVTFRKLLSNEIDEYVDSGSPMDKAGAYGIQDDFGAVFIEKIDGCFYNVVGFPLTKFYLAMLKFQKQLGLL